MKKFLEQKNSAMKAALAQAKQLKSRIDDLTRSHHDAQDRLAAFNGDKAGAEAEPLRELVRVAAQDKSDAIYELTMVEQRISQLSSWVGAPERHSGAVADLNELLSRKRVLDEKMTRVNTRLVEITSTIEAVNKAAAHGLKDAAQRLIEESDSVVTEMVAAKQVPYDMKAILFLQAEMEGVAAEITDEIRSLNEEIDKAKRFVRHTMNALAEIELEDTLLSVRDILGYALAAKIFSGAANRRRLELSIDFSDEELKSHLARLEASMTS